MRHTDREQSSVLATDHHPVPGHLTDAARRAAIAHDLQTPLTRLRLRLEKVTDETLRGKLVADLGAMELMIREGLDLATSLDTGGVKQRVDLDSLLSSVCADAIDAGQNVTLS